MPVLKELPLVKKTRRWTEIFLSEKSVKEMIVDLRHAQERKFSSLSKLVRRGPMLLIQASRGPK
jgi:hypothetical protein